MTRRQIHNLELAEVWAALRSRPDGLTAAEVAGRLAELGANALDPPPRWAWVRVLAAQLTGLFSVLLYVSAALCLVADRMQPGEGMLPLGLALVGVAALNAGFTFAQTIRAERAMAALRQFLPRTAAVRRAGVDAAVAIAELVPGDVLDLREGDQVPADARVIASHGLLVNNAPLTGESRHTAVTAEPAATGRLVDAPNLVFAGCAVIRGAGRAVVYATGRRTEFGKVAALSALVRRPPSPLEREVTRMVRILTVVALVMGLAFFAYGVAIGRPLWVNVVFMLGIIVANVPEGLLPTLTLALAMGGVRLARKRVLVKSLGAVEALGAVEVICTDKTGTLTRNQLAVTDVIDAVTGAPLAAEPRRALLTMAVAASELQPRGATLTGDPLDVAAATALTAAGGDPATVAAAVVRHLAFDVQRRRAAGVLGGAGGPRFAIKGAWEVVRSLVVLSDDDRARADAVVARLAADGRRLIAVASRPIAADATAAPEAELERDLELHGLLGLSDPLRPEVPAALARCHQAGLRVVLITGDHPATARAIAGQAGIVTAATPADAVITGDELELMREDALAERLRAGACVFARTTPEQKLKIVGALKRLELVVAMTGDGVNDAPALRAADVGIAMGASGTDVAREAAQLVLLDDDFASIVAAIEEGRTVFANIRKFTSYVLASNVPEIVPFLAYVALPVPLGLTVIQILSIDLGTDLMPAIALGQEPPDGEVMSQPPRGHHGRLLDRGLMVRSYLFLGLIQAAWAMLMFFTALTAAGWRYGDVLAASDPGYRAATGVTLFAVVATQVGNLIGRRYERRSGLDRGLAGNRLLVLGVAVELAFALAALYVPPVAAALGTGPAAPALVALAALGAPLLFGLDLLRKRRLRTRSPAGVTAPARR